MSNSTTQNNAVTNGKADKAALTVGTIAPGSHPAKTMTFVSGVAQQVSVDHDSRLYIDITTSAALKIEMGPTSACTIQISASQASALSVVTLFVHASWYVKLTGTMADVACTAVLE